MSETNSYNKATVSPSIPRVLTLTVAQLCRIELALEDHIDDLTAREERDPGQWTDELATARRTLQLVQAA